ncbi:MAG: GNAT family N-acetyltransferase [Kofleriaceae bacterium]
MRRRSSRSGARSRSARSTSSWGWVENWLACLPRAEAPKLAVLRDDDRAVAACFLGRRLAWQRRLVPARALYLNTTGVPRIDDLWIEYNGLVGASGMSIERLVEAVSDQLPGAGGWDELVLPALDEHAFGGLRDADHPAYRVLVTRRVPAYFVDLAKVRAAGYLPLLSGQTRSQVKRARRLAGDLEVTVARELAEAIEIYDELTVLHGAQWRVKHEPGAFADPWFDRVHRRLIATRFEHGEIELLRVRSGHQTIGCLYNHVFAGRVLQYQSGLAMYEDPHLKPGYICHSVAIERAATLGRDVYDLLAGDMRYKKSLSTDLGWLVWGKVQRRRLRFTLEDRAMTLWRTRRAASAAARS